jgi:predicted P-loop ATPase
VDLPALRRDRDQLWAEARTAYQAGEKWHLDSKELCELAAAETAEREERDDWIDIVARWLDAPNRGDLEQGLTTSEVLQGAIGMAPERITPAATKRIGHVLRALNFMPRQVRASGKWNTRERRYYHVTGSELETASSDVTCDNDTATNGSCHTVTREMDVHIHESGGGSCAQSHRANPSVTSVTCDVDSAEREAIEWEGAGQ